MENTEIPEEESEETEEETQDLYKTLAEEYSPETVAPFGIVLAIPSLDFQPEWESELKNQGYKVYASSLRGQTVMLVKDPHNQPLTNSQKKTVEESNVTVSVLENWGGKHEKSDLELKVKRGRRKKPKVESSETVEEPDITMSSLDTIPKTKRRWTREEEQIILDMTKEGHVQREIANKLGRTLNSVLNHLQVMRGQRNKGKWLDIEKSDILVPKTDLEGPSVPKSDSTPKVDSNPKFDAPETNEVFKELLMVAGQLYPNYKSVIRILLNEASKTLGS